MGRTDFDMIRLYRWYAKKCLKDGSITKEEYESVMNTLDQWEKL